MRRFFAESGFAAVAGLAGEGAVAGLRSAESAGASGGLRSVGVMRFFLPAECGTGGGSAAAAQAAAARSVSRSACGCSLDSEGSSRAWAGGAWGHRMRFSLAISHKTRTKEGAPREGPGSRARVWFVSKRETRICVAARGDATPSSSGAKRRKER